MEDKNSNMDTVLIEYIKSCVVVAMYEKSFENKKENCVTLNVREAKSILKMLKQ